jgi:dTDP-4-amino-4,6-dideoxygalactose transaminase
MVSNLQSTSSFQQTKPQRFQAALPATAVWSLASLRAQGEAALPSLLDAGPARLVTSGRVAIALALREMGIKPGDTVLVPAWHSPSMVPPVTWRGAQARFYKIKPDASIDLDDAHKQLDPSVKAMMVTHYFGFPQDLARVRAFCDRHGILLLEDCAHSFFGRHAGRPVGSVGDYAIGSSMKFYPIYEGGCLVSNRHSLHNVRLSSAGRGFEAKAMLAALEHSFRHGRLKGLELALRLPLAAKSALWNALKARRRSRAAGAAAPGLASELAPALAPDSSESSYNFDPRWIDKQSAWFSRWSMARIPASHVTALRRRHYRELQDALTGLPGWRPLFPALPEGVCPWMFPIVAERPDQLFARLHAAGLPMTHFGLAHDACLATTGCADSARLARHVLAFPCHQDLSAAERSWMSAQIRAALIALEAP